MYLDDLLADGGFDPIGLSGRRGRIFEQLRVNLNHHPATETVVVRPTRDQKDRKLIAQFDTQILVDGLVDADEARLEINWWTHPAGIDDQFKFHYVESTGYDCGWHRQPHPEGRTSRSTTFSSGPRRRATISTRASTFWKTLPSDYCGK